MVSPQRQFFERGFSCITDSVAGLPRHGNLQGTFMTAGLLSSSCTEELTGPANGACPMGRGAGTAVSVRLCWEFSARAGRHFLVSEGTCLIIGSPLVPQEQELKGVFKDQTSY